jgi:hypothetical protein
MTSMIADIIKFKYSDFVVIVLPAALLYSLIILHSVLIFHYSLFILHSSVSLP